MQGVFFAPVAPNDINSAYLLKQPIQLGTKQGVEIILIIFNNYYIYIFLGIFYYYLIITALKGSTVKQRVAVETVNLRRHFISSTRADAYQVKSALRY